MARFKAISSFIRQSAVVEVGDILELDAYEGRFKVQQGYVVAVNDDEPAAAEHSISAAEGPSGDPLEAEHSISAAEGPSGDPLEAEHRDPEARTRGRGRG